MAISETTSYTYRMERGGKNPTIENRYDGSWVTLKSVTAEELVDTLTDLADHIPEDLISVSVMKQTKYSIT